MTSLPPAAPIAVAINPHAAFGTTARAGAEVMAELARRGRYAVELRAETWSALADGVAGELRRGISALLVVGGDGMVHLAVNALAGTQVPLGIVPTGTGNDFARMFNLPTEPRTAVGHFLQALEQPRRVDLGRVTRADGTSCWFAGVLSAGFDAAVNDRANRWRFPRGRLRYPLAMLRELASFRPLRYSLVVDGVPRRTDAMLVAVANGRSIGGGMRIVPEAAYDDGALDLFIVSPLSRPAFLGIFPRVYAGRHTSHPAVHIERVRTVRLEASGVTAYADGEPVGRLPVSVDVVPGALSAAV